MSHTILAVDDSPSMRRMVAHASGWMVKPFDPERLLEMFGKLFA
ncbi:MAG TPA: hypothetical protein VF386_05020 [Usitatibacter sp.]